MEYVIPFFTGSALFLALCACVLALWACRNTVAEIKLLEEQKQALAYLNRLAVNATSDAAAFKRELLEQSRRIDESIRMMELEPGTVYQQQYDKQTGEMRYVKATELERLWQAAGSPMAPGKSAVDLARPLGGIE